MRRYIDKTVISVGIVLLLVLVIWQVCYIVSSRSKYRENMDRAKDLRESVAASNRPDEPRDPALYSGKVFNAWQNLTYANPLTPWDLYPDQ